MSGTREFRTNSSSGQVRLGAGGAFEVGIERMGPACLNRKGGGDT